MNDIYKNLIEWTFEDRRILYKTTRCIYVFCLDYDNKNLINIECYNKNYTTRYSTWANKHSVESVCKSF